MTDNSEAEREALLAVYRENQTLFRHYETQRSAVSGAVFAMVGLLMSFISFGGISTEDSSLALFIIVLGVFGAVFVAKQFERSSKHALIVKHCEARLDALIGDSALAVIKHVAGEDRRKSFKRIYKLKVHQLWVCLHLLIVLFGVWMFIRTLTFG